MKLKVYQQGGGLIYTPFIPGAQGSAAGASGNSGGSNDGLDPLDKELIALMKDQNLLPSDIQAIYNQLLAFQRKSQHLTALGGTAGYRAVMPGMLQIMQMVSIAKNNKERFDKSAQLMTDREAGGEVALDDFGYMWVMENESGKISKINPANFSREEYTPLSNSQVLDLRRNNPNLAFDTNSFETVGNNIIGMKQVQQEIADIINNFGNSKKSQYLPDTFQSLAKDVAEQGYFKVTVEKTRSLDDLNGFTKLLWDGLGNNARNLLTARASIVKENPLEYLRNIVFDYSDESVTPDFDANMTKAGGGNGGDGADAKNLTDRSYVEQVITGSNFEWPTQNRFAVIGNHADIWAYTQNTGLIQAGMNGGESVGYMPLDKLRNIEVFAQGSNQQKLTFGDKQVSTAQQSAIIYDDSAMYRVNLPSREDNGDIVPDWNTIDLIEQLKDRINPDLGKEQIDRILHQYDKDLYWDDATKTIVSNRSSWFLTFTGIVGSDFIQGIDFNSDHFEEITGPDAQIWHKRYDEAVKQNGKSSASQGRFGWLIPTKLYKANVYMPITNPLAGSKEYYNKATHMNNMQTQAIQEHRAEEQRKKENGTLKTNWSYGE